MSAASSFPRTPELEPFESLFLAWSLTLRRPWPPDPYLKAKARAAFSASMAERKISEAIARTVVIAIYQEELRRVVRELDMWTALAELLVHEAATHADASPWTAMDPRKVASVPTEEETAMRSRDWTWQGDRFVRVERRRREEELEELEELEEEEADHAR